MKKLKNRVDKINFLTALKNGEATIEDIEPEAYVWFKVGDQYKNPVTGKLLTEIEFKAYLSRIDHQVILLPDNSR